MPNPNRPRAPKYQQEDGQQAGRQHSIAGWPHLNSRNGACICVSACCHGKNGCICRACSGVGHVHCPSAQDVLATDVPVES